VTEQPSNRANPRVRWGIGVLVAGCGLVALIAVAADGTPLKGPKSSQKLEVGTIWGDLATMVVIAFLLIGVAMIIWSLLGPRGPRGPRVKRKRSWLPIVILAALMLALLVRERPETRSTVTPVTSADDRAANEETQASRRDQPIWPVIGLSGLVIAALVVAGASARRARLSVHPDDGPATSDEVADTFDASAATLLDDPDPRTAILAAYAQLLDGFEAAGLARRRGEAAHEHLTRSLTDLGVGTAPFEALVRSYDEARFSHHHLTSAHRDAALAAFRAASHDLRMAHA
jgi:hypothetical protein